MEDFELDQSTAEKPSKFTVEVNEDTLPYNPKTLAPRASDPLNLNGAVMIPCSPENVVVARNYAEALYRNNKEEYESHSRTEEEIIASIALHKFSELCVADYLTSNGIASTVDLKMYRVGDSWDYDFTVVTARTGHKFHIKTTDVPSARRMNGPSFVISTDDPTQDENRDRTKSYIIGCIVSSDWKRASLLFCIEPVESRNHIRSPMRFLLKKRCIYHITTRDLPHDDRWSCLRTLVKGKVKPVEVTDDESLSLET